LQPSEVSDTEGKFVGTFQIQNMATEKLILSGSHRYCSLQWDVKRKHCILLAGDYFQISVSSLVSQQQNSVPHCTTEKMKQFHKEM
jgi:hypothetical protein